MNSFSHGRLAPLLACASALAMAFSNVMAAEVSAPVPSAPLVAPPAPALAASTTVWSKLPEGTEVHVHLGERLSSATAAVGDTFQIISDEEIRLPDGANLPSGYGGKGEVTIAEKSGMLGKSGQLGLRLNYLKIGDAHIHLRANKSGEGKSGVTNAVVATVLLGPLGLLVRGHSIVYPKGQQLVAYVDQDAQIALPIAPPPMAD